jgi:hypothetical protein
MGRHQAIPLLVQQIAPGQTTVAYGPHVLANFGCNLQVEVATASAFVKAVTPVPRQSITVMAHRDTGATRTTISSVIAQHLALVQMGVAPAQTANGPTLNPTYAIDLLFVGSTSPRNSISASARAHCPSRSPLMRRRQPIPATLGCYSAETSWRLGT